MMEFASTRDAAFERLAEFEKKASCYSSRRNHVVPGHENVSRLSPAVRHRLITESELFAGITKRYAFSTVQKFVQEVYWRRYWKSWLSMRPGVWSDYLRDLSEMEPCEIARQAMVGEGPVEIMNYFARELIETGYLHNHARMWFAGYWVHTLQLPWQIGADFFYRHLLDADAASNTLSWRWVAGVQTVGKSYLARRSNLEKYLAPELLAAYPGGLEYLEKGRAAEVDAPLHPKAEIPSLAGPSFNSEKRSGLWIHEDDLSAKSVLPKTYSAVYLTSDLGPEFSQAKTKWLAQVYGAISTEWGCKVRRLSAESLVSWAKENGIEQVVAIRPEVGYTGNLVNEIRQLLMKEGIDLVLLDRKDDLRFLPYAKSGFFAFWKKVEPILKRGV